MKKSTSVWGLAPLAVCIFLLPTAANAQTNAYFIADTHGSPAYSLVVDERAGAIAVNVNRVGDNGFPSSVHYRVATDGEAYHRGSALAGTDFLPTEGTLTFVPSETNQTFTVTILDDDAIEGDKVFYITLDQATGGVRIENPSVGVIILDSERNPVRVDPDFKPEWPVEWPSDRLTAVQPADGKILLVTPADRVTGEDGVLVLRLLPDGRPDPAWQTAAVSGWLGLGFLVLQTNGQVLIAPPYNDHPPEDWSLNFSVNGVPRHHLARLNADGSLDTPFATSFPTNFGITGLALQRDGQILITASTESSNALFRLNTSGALDTTFNPPPVDRWSSIMALPDGSIILQSRDLIRLNPDGSRDTTFKPPPELVSIMAMQPDGRLLVTFWTNEVTYLTRLTLDGRLDATFIPAATSAIQVLPATDGKIWVATGNGWSCDSFRLQRKQADGSDDPTWPVAIVGTLRVGGSTTAFVLRELPDGNLLFAGLPSSDRVNGQLRTGLARLLVNAPLPRFEVDFTSAIVPENGGKVVIKLVRCGTNTEPITVTWRTEGGTAKAGVDYVPASGTLTFPAHESVATLELEVLDNAVPDADRTVRLRLQGLPPLSQEYPAVELTIANDDLGFAPGGIKHFPNGLVLLRYTGLPIPAWGDRGGWRAAPMGPGPGGSHIIETSENLRDWQEHDAYLEFVRREWIGEAAPTNVARFYRLRRSSQ